MDRVVLSALGVASNILVSNDYIIICYISILLGVNGLELRFEGLGGLGFRVSDLHGFLSWERVIC